MKRFVAVPDELWNQIVTNDISCNYKHSKGWIEVWRENSETLEHKPRHTTVSTVMASTNVNGRLFNSLVQLTGLPIVVDKTERCNWWKDQNIETVLSWVKIQNFNIENTTHVYLPDEDLNFYQIFKQCGDKHGEFMQATDTVVNRIIRLGNQPNVVSNCPPLLLVEMLATMLRFAPSEGINKIRATYEDVDNAKLQFFADNVEIFQLPLNSETTDSMVDDLVKNLKKRGNALSPVTTDPVLPSILNILNTTVRSSNRIKRRREENNDSIDGKINNDQDGSSPTYNSNEMTMTMIETVEDKYLINLDNCSADFVDSCDGGACQLLIQIGGMIGSTVLTILLSSIKNFVRKHKKQKETRKHQKEQKAHPEHNSPLAARKERSADRQDLMVCEQELVKL